MTQTDCILVSGLSYSVQKNRMLHQVDAQFASGKIHAILGQNGAGKSTLLRCLSKELIPTAGAVQWHGHPLKSLSYAQLALQRGVLSQSVELTFSFTVAQLIRLGVEVRGDLSEEVRNDVHITNRDANEQAEQAMEEVLQVCDLQHLQERDYLTLSGGEQKRAQLARVLAQIWPIDAEAPEAFKGKWLLLDEWTASLDIKHQQRLGRTFKMWAQQGLGIIMVLHDVGFAAQLADHCLLLKSGQVFTQGDVVSCLTEANLRDALEITVQVTASASGRPVIQPQLD